MSARGISGVVAVVAVAAGIGWSCRAAALSLSCERGTVRAGESAATVLARCGRPTYRDAYRVPLAPGLSVDRRVSVWYYDRGPRRLIAVLHFEQGVLLRIGTAGYGFGDSPPKHCEPPQISVGMTKYELLQTCGEPRRRSAIEGLWSPARGLPPGAGGSGSAPRAGF